jgi:hypothetical protein
MARRYRPRKALQIVRADDLAWSFLERTMGRDQLNLMLLRRGWHTLFSPRIQERLWPAALRDGELVLHARDHQWLTELRYLEGELRERITSAVPALAEVRLKLRVGPIASVDERAIYVPTPLPPEPPQPEFKRLLDPEPPPETVAAIAAIEDPKLRAAVALARVALSRPR